MTNSLAITPQRQRRDFTKKPQRGPTIAAPAAPAQEPRQVGDQLLDMRRYEPGNQAQAIESIQNFVGKQGGLSKLSQWAMEAHVKKAEKDAQALREQRAEAYMQFGKIADETERLEKKKKFLDAKNNRLANPWTNFFYYEKESEKAANEAVLKLNAWGGNNVTRLANNEDDSEISYELNTKAKEIQSKYANIPQSWQRGVIEPKLAAVQNQIKEKVYEKRFELADVRMDSAARVQLVGGIKNAVRTIKDSKGALTEDAINAIKYNTLEAQKLLLNHYGDERTANAKLAEMFKKLWIDTDKPEEPGYGKNDLGEYLTGPQIQIAIKGIQGSKSGIELGELRDKDGNSINRILDQGFKAAYDLQDAAAKAELAEIRTTQKLWKKKQREKADGAISDFKKNNDRLPTAEERQDMAGDHLKVIDNDFSHSGQTQKEGTDDIYKLYMGPVKIPARGVLNQWKSKVNAMNRRGEYLDEAEKAELRTYGQYDLIQSNTQTVDQWRSDETTALREGVIQDLKDETERRIMSHESLATTAQESKLGTKKESTAKLAVGVAQQRLVQEVDDIVNDEIDKAIRADENALSDAKTRRTIFENINSRLENQPQYSDPNHYYNINQPDGTALFTEYELIPDVSVTTKNRNGSWNIEPLSLDNLETWSTTARKNGLPDNPAEIDRILNNQFIFDERQMNEVIRALTTANTKELSSDTKKILENFNYATNGVKPLNEVILQQALRYVGDGVPAAQKELWQKSSNLLKGSLVHYTVVPPNFTQYDLALEAKDYNPGITADGKLLNRVRFRLRRPDGQVGNNGIPSPVGGSVIDSGTNDTYGNYIIIRASTNGKGFRKGDRIMISGGSKVLVDIGQVSVGRKLMLTGGSGTVTGGLSPGYLQMTLFNPGEGFPDRLDQKPQSFQVDFVEQNLYPLIRRIR